MLKGVSKEEFCACFQVDMLEIYQEVIDKNMKDQLLMWNQDGNLALTRRGIDISNYVMAQFLL